MPANKKHLIKSPWEKTSKIIVSILGGLAASVALHLGIGSWVFKDFIVMVSLFTIYALWAFFIIMVYWIRKSWVSWAILSSITILSVIAVYLSKNIS